MKRLSVVAILSVLVMSSGIRSAHAQATYQIVCPLFALFDTDEGWLTYCNAYPTSCDDVPDPFLAIWSVYPEPCDCPDTSGCDVLNGTVSLNDVIRPIKSKVASLGRPEGLDPRVRIAKSEPVYFMKDDEPIYMRLFDFISTDDKHLDHTCSLIIGVEMKSPKTGTQGLQEIKDVQSTDRSYVFTLNHGGRITYLIRAMGVLANDAGHAPTPVLAPKANDTHGQVSILVQNQQGKENSVSASSSSNTK
jgi:hypothetical protein